MTDTGVLELAQHAVAVALMVCAPILGVGMIVGLIVSIFQAATQIQEATLSFVPKIMAVMATMVICGPWMLRSIVTFTEKLLNSIPSLAR